MSTTDSQDLSTAVPTAISTANDPKPPTQTWCFGPTFFAVYLHRFVRDHCPGAEETLPKVELHLLNGQTLDLCHIIGVTPTWVALVVFAGRRSAGARMRTELVPYALIARVTVSECPSSEGSIGFDMRREPRVLHEEQDLGNLAGLVAALHGSKPDAAAEKG